MTAGRPAGAAAAGPKAAEGPGRGGIQSLERAVCLLEEIASHRDGITLAELCKRVGLHNSTAFHLVKTMLQLGYARQDPESKKYRIGSKLLALAAGALDENVLARRVTPALETLAELTGESAHFAIRSGDDVIIIARTSGPGMFQLVNRAGDVRPTNATALGKILLAAMNPAQIERYLDGRVFQRFTSKTIVEHVTLLAALDEVRRNGIAFDDGELDADVRCVAVAVHDFRGRVAGAIGISGPMWRLSLQALQDKSKIVRQSAERLSEELGSCRGANVGGERCKAASPASGPVVGEAIRSSR